MLILFPSIYFGYQLVKEEQFKHKAEKYIENVSLFEGSVLLKSKINLDKINNGKALLATDTSGKSGEIDTAVSQAKAAHAAGDDKKCIEITSKALQDLQNSEKGGQ